MVRIVGCEMSRCELSVPPMYKMNVLSDVALNRLNPNELTFGRSKVQVRSGHDQTFGQTCYITDTTLRLYMKIL